MPEIKITGNKPPYTPAQRREADYDNANNNAVYNTSRRLAEDENQRKRVADAAERRAIRDSGRNAMIIARLRERNFRTEQRDEEVNRRKQEQFLNKTLRDIGTNWTMRQKAMQTEAYNQNKLFTQQKNMAERQVRDAENVTRRIAYRMNADDSRRRAIKDRTGKRFDSDFNRATAEESRKQDSWERMHMRAQSDNDKFDKRKADAARRAAMSPARRDPLDPETYIAGGIRGIGGQGAAAIRNRDALATAAARRRLNRIERRTIARGGPQSRLNAIAEARAGMSGAAELEELGGMAGARMLGPIGIGVGVAYEAAKKFFTMPSKIAGFAQGIQSMAEPYDQIKYGSAELGRANGFEGSGILNGVYQTGQPAPEWMRRLGLTPQEAVQIAQRTGMPYANATDALETVMDLGKANRMVGLAGLGTDRLGASLNLGRTLGVSFNNEDGDRVHFSGNSYRSGIYSSDPMHMGTQSTNPAYLKLLSDATARGTTLGLDRSQTLNNVESLFKQAASAGAIRPDASGLSDFYLGIASRGSAAGRTGEEQLSIQSGIQSSIQGMGVGGNPSSNAVLQSRITQMGGLPQDRGALAKFFGISEAKLAEFESTPAGKDAVDYMLQSAKAGNSIAFGSYAQSFLSSHQDIATGMYDSSPLNQSLPGYMRPLGRSAYYGVTPQSGIDMGSAGNASVTSTAIGTARQRALLDVIGSGEARGYNSLYGDSRDHPNQFSDMSRFPQWGGAIVNGLPTHAAGRYQFQPDTWNKAAKALGLTDMSPESQDRAAMWLAQDTYSRRFPGRDIAEDMADPARRGAVYSTLRSQWSSAPSGPSAAYDARYERAYAAENARTGGGAVNDTSREDARRATTGQLITGLGEQGNAIGNAMLGGDTGNLMIALSGGVVQSTQSLTRFSSVLDAVSSRLANVVSAASSTLPGPRVEAPRTVHLPPLMQ